MVIVTDTAGRTFRGKWRIRLSMGQRLVLLLYVHLPYPNYGSSQKMQSTIQSVLKKLRSTHSKGLEVPGQNTFKDKPAFIMRLIKVLVAKNLFLVHSSSCRNNRFIWKPPLRFHLWIYYNTWPNLTQEIQIQFLEFMGGPNVLQTFPNYLICLHYIRINMVY